MAWARNKSLVSAECIGGGTRKKRSAQCSAQCAVQCAVRSAQRAVRSAWNLYAIPKQTRFQPRNSKKQAPHTRDKLRISRTQSLLIALVSLFCTTYFPPYTKGENHVWKSTFALAALPRSHCCCFGHNVAEFGQCEQRKRPMHDLFSLQRLFPYFRFILKSNINPENGDAQICLNKRLSCAIAANLPPTCREILAPVHNWRRFMLWSFGC